MGSTRSVNLQPVGDVLVKRVGLGQILVWVGWLNIHYCEKITYHRVYYNGLFYLLLKKYRSIDSERDTLPKYSYYLHRDCTYCITYYLYYIIGVILHMIRSQRIMDQITVFIWLQRYILDIYNWVQYGCDRNYTTHAYAC